MLSPRKETILKSIVGQYITKATPVPSQSIIDDCELGISAATIRNEMAYLEHEGYITRLVNPPRKYSMLSAFGDTPREAMMEMETVIELARES